MPYVPPPELAELSLSEIAALVAARKLPPVEQWQPVQTSDSLMRIAGDGRWYHNGGEIRRPAMVRAFSSLLRRDADGAHWLVTPYEKQAIVVEDAAFVAIDVKQQDGALMFRLNTDEFVIASADHPIVARGDRDTPALYVTVRNGIEARLNRSTYAQLVEIALNDQNPPSLGEVAAPTGLAEGAELTRPTDPLHHPAGGPPPPAGEDLEKIYNSLNAGDLMVRSQAHSFSLIPE